MKYGDIIIEKYEFEKLKDLLKSTKNFKDLSYKSSISKLAEELSHAKIMPAPKMPEDVVRFNSLVTISSKFSAEKTYQLVMPEHSDLKQQKISILAPMGLALFGYAAGDEILWQFPSGESTITINKVEQAEPLLKTDKS